MLWKKIRRRLSWDGVPLFIALFIINISFDLYLYILSESIEKRTLTNNRKLFNEWITRKLQNQYKNE